MARKKKPGFSGVPDRTLEWARREAKSLDLAGKEVAVVGGTNGLGRALSRAMAERGAQVTVVGRTFRDRGSPRIDFMKADLSLMSEAVRVGRELPSNLEVVVLTTGIFAAPRREETVEGLERDMAVSYLSRLALLRELAPRLQNGRVFVMGFPGTGQAGDLDDLNSERSYRATDVHMNTVAGNEALVLDSVERYPNASFYGLNPGLVQTGIRANFLGEGSIRFRIVETLIGWFTIDADTYAARTVPLLFAPELEDRSGAMFNQNGQAILPSEALTPDRVRDLIAQSEALVARARASSAKTPRKATDARSAPS
jgi:hypothetical protein